MRLGGAGAGWGRLGMQSVQCLTSRGRSVLPLRPLFHSNAVYKWCTHYTSPRSHTASPAHLRLDLEAIHAVMGPGAGDELVQGHAERVDLQPRPGEAGCGERRSAGAAAARAARRPRPCTLG